MRFLRALLFVVLSCVGAMAQAQQPAGTRGSGFSYLGDMNQTGVQMLQLVYFGSAGATSGYTVGAMQVGLDAVSGGVNNDNGPKTNYAALNANMWAQTIGQVGAIIGETSHYADGDSAIIDGLVYSWGSQRAAGDEGTEGITIGVYQGYVAIKGTVTGVVGNVVSYNSATDENTRGESRPLINTNAAKVYTTGVISTVTTTIISGGAHNGRPQSTITGSGTTWTTLGSGPVTDLFMSIDSMISGGLKLVVQIARITDDTHLTLLLIQQGNSTIIPPTAYGAYACEPTCGNYSPLST
jgi:hypothetical protein